MNIFHSNSKLKLLNTGKSHLHVEVVSVHPLMLMISPIASFYLTHLIEKIPLSAMELGEIE